MVTASAKGRWGRRTLGDATPIAYQPATGGASGRGVALFFGSGSCLQGGTCCTMGVVAAEIFGVAGESYLHVGGARHSLPRTRPSTLPLVYSLGVGIVESRQRFPMSLEPEVRREANPRGNGRLCRRWGGILGGYGRRRGGSIPRRPARAMGPEVRACGPGWCRWKRRWSSDPP